MLNLKKEGNKFWTNFKLIEISVLGSLIDLRSDGKSQSRDTELSSVENEGEGREHSSPVGTKATSSSAGQSARSAPGRLRRSTSIHSSAQSQSQVTPAARVESSRPERLPSDREEELIEDEEFVAELRSVLDEMSASEFLELTSDISEEDLIDDDVEEVSSDVTAPVNANLNSRTKRGIVFMLKKHLLKGHIRRKILGKKLRHKARKIAHKARKIAHKARGATGHAVRLGILGAGAAGLGGLAGAGYSSANNN